MTDMPKEIWAGLNVHSQPRWQSVAPPDPDSELSRAIYTKYTRADLCEGKEPFDYQRVLDWAESSPRKPAVQSFTDSVNRQAAYLIEQYDSHRADTEVLLRTEVAELRKEVALQDSVNELLRVAVEEYKERIAKLQDTVRLLRADHKRLREATSDLDREISHHMSTIYSPAKMLSPAQNKHADTIAWGKQVNNQPPEGKE